MTYDVSLFIFRRDLRLVDNTALNAALRNSKKVIACFIFDDRQIQSHSYQSKPALHFMLQSLSDLAQQFKSVSAELNFFEGLPTEIIQTLHSQQKIQAVFFNRDYTPFSLQRDGEIATVCEKLNVDLFVCADALLNEPEQAVKHDGSAYKVFTAFYNNARQIPVAFPKKLEDGDFLTVESNTTLAKISELDTFHATTIQGGRNAALQQLADLTRCADYTNTRDFPALQSTSQLSAHLKFGTISVREMFYTIAETLDLEHPLTRQLYWRDFLTHIGFHFPRVFGHAFIEKFDSIPWEKDLQKFQAWAEGKTGFPIVDAGMRELNETGFMHNRVRMIVASFLTKDLRISWRWGERYFAQHLVDYDPCLNNGNWQWAASTGCDAQPYFRIFNPWLQQQKFDENCDYIYRYIPELRAVPAKILHEWHKKHYGHFYPKPIVEHSEESKLTKTLFKNAEGK
jgi:deoxyribodipyrimidine photo-lyase